MLQLLPVLPYEKKDLLERPFLYNKINMPIVKRDDIESNIQKRLVMNQYGLDMNQKRLTVE